MREKLCLHLSLHTHTATGVSLMDLRCRVDMAASHLLPAEALSLLSLWVDSYSLLTPISCQWKACRSETACLLDMLHADITIAAAINYNNLNSIKARFKLNNKKGGFDVKSREGKWKETEMGQLKCLYVIEETVRTLSHCYWEKERDKDGEKKKKKYVGEAQSCYTGYRQDCMWFSTCSSS